MLPKTYKKLHMYMSWLWPMKFVENIIPGNFCLIWLTDTLVLSASFFMCKWVDIILSSPNLTYKNYQSL